MHGEVMKNVQILALVLCSFLVAGCYKKKPSQKKYPSSVKTVKSVKKAGRKVQDVSHAVHVSHHKHYRGLKV